MNTESDHSEVRPNGLAGYALGVLALLTCPCHLPILALLLSGTAAGALLSEHLVPAAALFSVLFIVFLVTALRALRGNEPSPRTASARRDALSDGE